MAIDLIKFRDFAYLKNGEVKKEGDDGWKDGNCGDGTLYVVGYKDEGLGGSDPEFRVELNNIGDIHNLLDVAIDANNRLYLTFNGQPFGTGDVLPTSGGEGGDDFDVSKLRFYFDNGDDPTYGKRFYLKYGDLTVTDPISFDVKMNADGQHLDFSIGDAITKSVLLPTGSQSGVTSVVRRSGDVEVKTIIEAFNELYPNHKIDDYKGQVLVTKTKLLVNGVEDPYLIPTYLPIPADDTPGGSSGETEIVVVRPTLKNVTVTDLPGDRQSFGRFVEVTGEENTYDLELNIKTLQGIQGQQGIPGQDGQDGKDGVDGKDGKDGQDGSDANINVVEGSVTTGENPSIKVAESVIGGVKTYSISAVLPQAGSTTVITPSLRFVNVQTNEDGITTGNFTPVENTENVYDVNLNLPVVRGADGQDGAPGKDGADGRSISSIDKTAVDGNIDTYTIMYNDGTSTVFKVTNGVNGHDGHDGQDGVNGTNGINGTDGRGISSVVKTSTSGNVDTYTMTFTDGTSFNFNVTNGVNGEDGTDGTNGVDGNDGEDGTVFELYRAIIFPLNSPYIQSNNGGTPYNGLIDNDSKNSYVKFAKYDVQTLSYDENIDNMLSLAEFNEKVISYSENNKGGKIIDVCPDTENSGNIVTNLTFGVFGRWHKSGDEAEGLMWSQYEGVNFLSVSPITEDDQINRIYCTVKVYKNVK